MFRTQFLTKHLDGVQHLELANAMFRIVSKKGERIIRYGDVGNVYYVLGQGSCKVTVYEKGTDPADPDL